MMDSSRPRVSSMGSPPPSQWESVAASECVHPDCEAKPQSRFSFPIALCSNHVVQVLTRSTEVVREAAADAGKRWPNGRATHPSLVYYVQFGNRIKIGTTTDLKNRLSCLPHDRLLAVENGDYEVEHARHLQFAADRITKKGEWFRPSPELLSHIASLKLKAPKNTPLSRYVHP